MEAPVPGKTHFRFLAIAIFAALAVTLAVALPGVSAAGDEDQGPPVPEKAELKYPNLGSQLDQLVTSVEDGETTAADAAAGTSMHREESVAVTIYLSGSVDDVVQFLEDFGGDPRNVGEDYIEAYVPVSLLGPVSEQPGVLRVREIIPPQPDFGPITSQGVQAHLSAAWNQAGYSGQGIKVGIIDFGFKDLTSLMGTELPARVQGRCYTDIDVFTQDLADCEAVDDATTSFPECLDDAQRRAVRSAIHGTIVAESVIDIAPEVSLYIANPISRADLQAAADWMASEGVSVINYSAGWIFDGPGDGTSPLSASPLNTVDRAVANDIIWVNSAGNNAQETWFGGYSDPDDDKFINFVSGNVEVNSLPLRACRSYMIQLRWEDDWNKASTDLDLYLYHVPSRSFTTLVSEDEQSGQRGHVPFEAFGFTYRVDSDDFGIVVVHHSGDAPDWIQLAVWSVDPIQHHTGSGSITNPAESANPGMLAVGAAPWYDVNTIEPYSSRGPTPDGRVKPDIVGADCGETALTPLNEYWRGFCGTSQAAPHVAGMAALVRQRFPSHTPAQVAAYLQNHAQQRETPDPNNTWGHGFAQLPSPDREALMALYNDTGGANWTDNTNWLTNAPVGQWYGVITDGNGRVTELNLTSNQLQGEISRELGTLTNLKVLALGGNELTGTIPTWLDSLANLDELYLWGNELTGEIPSELGNLANMVELHLADNQLTGEIPSELGSLSSLTVLSLSRNELTGEIPVELVGLTNLEELWLSENQLTGEIPSWLGSLTNLEELWLADNQLTGEIPSELGNLSSLTNLVFWGNKLSGEIPPELGRLSILTVLSISRNELTGEIPAELRNLANLELLSLSANQLTGEIPSELGNLANLVELHLADNQLTGAIPTELGSLANLEVLSLSDNQLSGEVPQTLAGLTMLESLSFYNNLGLCAPVDDAFQTWLRGISIVYGSSCAPADSPEDRDVLIQAHSATDGAYWTNNTHWLSDEHSIREWYGVTIDANGRVNGLFLGDNQLTGAIPTELGSLANLTSLRLSENQLSGAIPTELGSLAKLKELWLSENRLTGEIPVELGSLANLEELHLWGNELTGEIPVELGTLANLTSLNLSQNKLTGAIPTELGSLAKLKELWLSENQLTGEIPVELGRLTNLTVLYLSGNQLTGCVPARLRDVADNDFAELGLSCTSQEPLITRYDANGTGAIEISELFSAIDDYFAGRIEISKLFDLIDLYFSGY